MTSFLICLLFRVLIRQMEVLSTVLLLAESGCSLDTTPLSCILQHPDFIKTITKHCWLYFWYQLIYIHSFLFICLLPPQFITTLVLPGLLQSYTSPKPFFSIVIFKHKSIMSLSWCLYDFLLHSCFLKIPLSQRSCIILLLSNSSTWFHVISSHLLIIFKLLFMYF